MLRRNALACARAALGQIRLSPRPPKCRSGASGSPPILDSVAAAVRISGLCQEQNRVTADDPSSGGRPDRHSFAGGLRLKKTEAEPNTRDLIFEPFTFANSLPWRTPVMGAS